jgi:F-type H+-transporting ATPase subunit delta
LHPTLLNPLLKVRDKNSLVKSAISERVSRQMWRFIRLVVRNHRENMLQLMALNYLAIYRKARNIHIATVETAVPLSTEIEERLKKWILAHTQGTVELYNHINPELIGGFIFQMNYHRVDGSISSQITEIKRQFKEN